MDASESIHPTDETLHAHALGQLDRAATESVGNHLKSCAECGVRSGELASGRLAERIREIRGVADGAGPMMSSTAGLSVFGAGAAGSPGPPLASTLPPAIADHPNYEILRELGRGGMGVVYLAQNKLLGRTEVLKVVSGHLLNRDGVLDRFQIEIRNAARLHHPNIVTAYSAFRIGESLVLAMEFVEGVTWSRWSSPAVRCRSPIVQLRVPGGARLTARPRAGHGAPRHQAGQPDAGPPKTTGL